MSFLTVTKQNPGAVTKRLQTWSNIQNNDLVMKTINQKLDELYQIIYKASPVKTGYMRSTIKVSGGADFAQIAVTAYYAIYVEKGTKRTRPHPFFYGNVTSFSVDIVVAVRQMFATVR
jgi:hypothetical protein